MELKNHLEKLHYFFEVARLGSVKQAAQALHITQPSVTKSIQVLEDVIGKRLFHRVPRGMKVTIEGEVLLRYCYELFAGVSDLEARLNTPNDPFAGSLKVGTYDSIAMYFWPSFFRSFILKFPKLNIELTTGRSQYIQSLVEKGELDLGLIISPTPSNQSLCINLTTDSFRLYETNKVEAIYKNHETAPLIYMPDALAGDDHIKLEKLLTLKNSHHLKSYKTSSLESAKELALNGLGMALLPRMVAKNELKSKELKLVEDHPLNSTNFGEHQIGILYSKYREHSEMLKKLIEELQAQNW